VYSGLVSIRLMMVQAKKQYEKAYKDGEKAVENYKRIDADPSFPRIDVEKVIVIGNIVAFQVEIMMLILSVVRMARCDGVCV
jgi:ABC-type polysaccharide transport system permease subunit